MAGARVSARCQKWANPEGFVAFSTTTTTTPHYALIHYATTTTYYICTPTLHSSTLHYTTLQLHYTTFHYATLHTLWSVGCAMEGWQCGCRVFHIFLPCPCAHSARCILGELIQRRPLFCGKDQGFTQMQRFNPSCPRREDPIHQIETILNITGTPRKEARWFGVRPTKNLHVNYCWVMRTAPGCLTKRRLSSIRQGPLSQ